MKSKMNFGVTGLFGSVLIAGTLLGSVNARSDVAPDDVVINDDLQVAATLTSNAGDPANGRNWFQDRKLGNCLACHQNEELAEQPFHGEVGPEMDGVGDRYSEAELRAIVVDSKKVFGDQTIMPAFYRTSGFTRPAGKFAGKSILTAQQVEDVVAYLLTLKE